jgi:hypothetical protein
LRVERDAPRQVGRRAGQLRQQTAEPADRHAGGDRGCEQVAGVLAIAGQALGHDRTDVRADQAGQDAAVAVEPLLGHRRVLAQVKVLQPGAEPAEERTADERAGHDVPQPVVADPAAAHLQREHQRGDPDAQGDEHVVSQDRDRPKLDQHRMHGRSLLATRGDVVKVPD